MHNYTFTQGIPNPILPNSEEPSFIPVRISLVKANCLMDALMCAQAGASGICKHTNTYLTNTDDPLGEIEFNKLLS